MKFKYKSKYSVQVAPLLSVEPADYIYLLSYFIELYGLCVRYMNVKI